MAGKGGINGQPLGSVIEEGEEEVEPPEAFLSPRSGDLTPSPPPPPQPAPIPRFTCSPSEIVCRSACGV